MTAPSLNVSRLVDLLQGNSQQPLQSCASRWGYGTLCNTAEGDMYEIVAASNGHNRHMRCAIV
jgi:hypothetical protein